MKDLADNIIIAGFILMLIGIVCGWFG